MSRLTVDEAAVVSGTVPDRLRELEAGLEMSFQEGPRIAAAYLLCARCFKRLIEAAVERDIALTVAAEPAIEPPPDWPAEDVA
jgi:hypothetical protein